MYTGQGSSSENTDAMWQRNHRLMRQHNRQVDNMLTSAPKTITAQCRSQGFGVGEFQDREVFSKRDLPWGYGISFILKGRPGVLLRKIG